MKTSDFYYHLPKDFIAQKPIQPRDSSRLLIFNRKSGAVSHQYFRDVVGTFNSNDLLILNYTRVIQARLFGKKIPTGGKVELLLLRELGEGSWQAMVGGKGLNPGNHIQITDGPQAVIEVDLGGPLRLIKFQEPIQPFLKTIGQVPLPPYIHESLKEPERYQTIYARQTGSAAAPTAGLHFTSELLDTIREQGINIAEVTLHIGLDTFAPVHEEDPRKHIIHKEWCELSLETASAINTARQMNGRIIAVGTTSVRTLETAALASKSPDVIEPFEGETDLFILPGYSFKVVDCMLTNFHLPESTLLMMVSAFTGRKKILELYELAKQEGYRFYSFGDAMLLV
ncbi:MAG: tRNA preQ1(34) S-adenosylmethionine ribosyltransferase-isomerase QueA [Anaerolineales bacterium]|nr:tRNA preQ1(34) S-adenosylmethionine ribosyltransferase-isomerase QueA [Anaerolineales bacterium]